MAYMNQERKKELAGGIKESLKRYGLKGTISTDRFTIKVNIRSGGIDFIKNANDVIAEAREVRPDDYRLSADHVDYVDVNVYHIDKMFTGVAREALEDIYHAAMKGNHDNSDIMTDYFDVGWYVDINVGKYDKPYKLEV